MTNPCPTSTTLQGLLTGTLDDDTLAHVSTHIETCRACQQLLDEMSQAALPQTAFLRHETPRTAFLQQLQATPTPNGTPATPTRIPTIPGFEIVRELGRGGVGVVYEALQTDLGRKVALKVLLGGTRATPEELQRFRAEAQSVAQLNHPGIVQVYEIGDWQPDSSTEPLPYLCMEFAEGGSLDRHINRQPQEPVRAAQWLVTLAEAVHVAHQAGVIHRDLKPANVLLTQAWQTKIVDFGLAKRLDLGSGHTQTGVIMGTPSYMSPEQARGDHAAISPRTDVYALGAILYELLTGRPPFQGVTALDTALQVVEQEPLATRQLQPTVPRDLDTICLKCLRKDPAKRYATALELADDVQRYLDGKPILARPVSSVERFRKFARRHPWPVGLASILTTVIVGSILSLSFLYLRKEDARRQEEIAKETAQEERRLTALERDKAEQARDRLKKFNSFLLNKILFTPNPGISLGKTAPNMNTVTLRQSLYEAQEEIPSAFAAYPDLRGTMHETFGRTFQVLGDIPSAKRNLEAAIAVRTTHYGADHELTYESKHSLGLLLYDNNERDAGLAMLRDCHDYFRSTKGLANIFTTSSCEVLAKVAWKEEDFNTAAKLYREVWQGDVELHGDADPETMRVAYFAGEALVLAGRLQEAAPHFHANLELAKAKFSGHPVTLLLRDKYGETLLQLHEYEKARPVLEEALAIRQQQPENFNTFFLQANLAEAYQHLNLPTDAEKHFRAAIEGCLKSLPKGSYRVPQMRCRLALCLAHNGREPEATTMLKEAVESLRNNFFVPRKVVLEMLTQIATHYETHKQPTEAAHWRTERDKYAERMAKGK